MRGRNEDGGVAGGVARQTRQGDLPFEGYPIGPEETPVKSETTLTVERLAVEKRRPAQRAPVPGNGFGSQGR